MPGPTTPQNPQQAAIAALQAKAQRVAMVIHAAKMAMATDVFESDSGAAVLMLYLSINTLEGVKTTINIGDPAQQEAGIALRAAVPPGHLIWKWVDVVNQPLEEMDVNAPLDDAAHQDALSQLDDGDPMESPESV